MLPFPELHTVSEKYFSEQLELNSPNLSATNSYFPFSPPQTPTFAADGLSAFLLFSAATDHTNTAPHPPPNSPIPIDAATVIAAMSKRNVVDHDHRESSSIRRKMISTRKYRHSKICTANGLRDCRMRLSRDVGHKFFNLQDKLGMDTPSKTVQWLIDMSESAIKELSKSASKLVCKNSFSNQSPNDEPCISELGEDASSICDSKGKSAIVLEVTNNPADQVKKNKRKRLANQTFKKAAINPILKKESRDRARARARERTREKKRMSFLTSPIPIVTTIDKQPSSQSLNSSTCREIAYSQSINKQHMKLTDERNSELQVTHGGIGLKRMLDYSNQTAITGLNDTFYLFQDQWDMERELLTDAHNLYSRPF